MIGLIIESWVPSQRTTDFAPPLCFIHESCSFHPLMHMLGLEPSRSGVGVLERIRFIGGGGV